MKRIAILGGGIAGLTAAYELELARQRGAALDWHLYEATDRLGGIVDTTRLQTAQGEWILEGGPDAWVSEKPWARELAVELGLAAELIFSNDATRKTYIYLDGRLQALPDRMRMMVPEDLATLEGSPLFSDDARRAYAGELAAASRLRAESPFAEGAYDESVADFVRRHFGDEVLLKVAGPLLSGVFGGDVEKLSVRAAMAPFVAMEQEHGSLIAALQHRARERGPKPPQPIFTSLRRGIGSLMDALVPALPAERLHCRTPVYSISFDTDEWFLDFAPIHELTLRQRLTGSSSDVFDTLVLATSLPVTRSLLQELDPVMTTLLPSSGAAVSLLPQEASSAILANFCWAAEAAAAWTIPPGFGFLVPPDPHAKKPQLLAATFVDQKFPHRAPPDARIVRAFFGTDSAEHFAASSDAEVAQAALAQLRAILGSLPDPDGSLTTVRRWPQSLPQYEVGHLGRMAELNRMVAQFDGSLYLLGNSYRGVGLPDLIRDARAAARAVVATNA